MRISDWISDVCSSDLDGTVVSLAAAEPSTEESLESTAPGVDELDFAPMETLPDPESDLGANAAEPEPEAEPEPQPASEPSASRPPPEQIGRAWVRDRVCQYV